MELELTRYGRHSTHTAGIISIEGYFDCFTIEDPIREVKIPGETAIPPGRYRILYRNEGGMVQSYKRKYPWHKGMLELQDVPNFTYVYIHVGNFVEDTHGCILVGARAVVPFVRPALGSSRLAYTDLYETIDLAFRAGEEVWITVK